MPDPGHLEVFVRGPAAWNAWRAGNPSIIPDLGGVTPSPGERQLGLTNGGPIDLRCALLQDADFRFATLTSADLEGATLVQANLADARLDGANLTAADLSRADLERVDFSGAVLERTNLAGANLHGARNLTPAQLWRAVGDAGTTLPDGLTRPPHWLARSASSALEPHQPEDPYTAQSDSGERETPTPGLRVIAGTAQDEIVLSQSFQRIGPIEPPLPHSIDVPPTLDAVTVEEVPAWIDGPRPVSRSRLTAAIWLGYFLAVAGFVWYVAFAPADEGSARRTAVSPPPVELKSPGVTVAPRPAVGPEISVGALDRGTAPPLQQDIQPAEVDARAPIATLEPGGTGVTVAPRPAADAEKAVETPAERTLPSLQEGAGPAELSARAPVLLGPPSAPRTALAPPVADQPTVDARDVPLPTRPTPSPGTRPARVGQSTPPPGTSEPRSPPRDEAPKPRPPKAEAPKGRDAASDILSGGLQ